MRKKNQDLLVDAAEKLFRKYGIKKVSVEEICAEAGVSKMTFYRSFSNKIEIAGKVLSILSDRGITKYHAIMNTNEPFAERIQSLITMKGQDTETFGEELIKDIYSGDNEQLNAIIEKYRRASLNLFIDDLKKAQDKGWVRKNLKPELVLAMIRTIQEKMSDPTFLSLFKNPQEATEEILNTFFYGILLEER